MSCIKPVSLESKLTIAVALAMIVAGIGLTWSGCKPRPSPSSTSPAPTLDAAPSPPSPAPASSGPLAPVIGLDLCTKTDLSPLADLKVKVRKTKRDPMGNAEAACFFDFRTASGRDGSMLVAVTTFKSVEEAKQFFGVHRKLRQENGMNYEGSLTAIGEEADGFSKETDKKEYQQAEYLILARLQNRHVEAWFSLFGKPLTPKKALADKARALLLDTAALASKP